MHTRSPFGWTKQTSVKGYMASISSLSWLITITKKQKVHFHLHSTESLCIALQCPLKLLAPFMKMSTISHTKRIAQGISDALSANLKGEVLSWCFLFFVSFFFPENVSFNIICPLQLIFCDACTKQHQVSSCNIYQSLRTHEKRSLCTLPCRTL